jgi:hypothetical protein
MLRFFCAAAHSEPEAGVASKSAQPRRHRRAAS